MDAGVVMTQPSALSLRVRLTLWYGIALALILVVFSGVLYAVTAKGLRDQVDGDLREAADAAVRSLQQSQMGPIFNFEELASKFPELAVLDKFFQILTPTGRIFIESPNIKARDILPSQQALARARNGEVWIESVRIPDTPPLRIITVPVMFNETLVNIVRAGTSLQPVEETLHRLLLVLLLTAPIGLSVALVGGWFLADRALRPVEA